MRQCVECGTELPDETEECPACDTADEPFRCSRCGEQIGGGDACPACGWARVDFGCVRHPDERALGRCVICTVPVCRACRRGDGRALLCEAHRAVNVIQGWAQLYTTTSEFEAQLVRENLLAEGIEARIFSQKDKMLSVDLGELSIVRILVPAWEFENAQGVIRDHMTREGEVTFACPACGEAYDAGVDACASCGTPRGMRRTD